MCPVIITHIDSVNTTCTSEKIKETITSGLQQITINGQNTSNSASVIVTTGATIGAIVCFIAAVIVILVIIFILRRGKRNLGNKYTVIA